MEYVFFFTVTYVWNLQMTIEKAVYNHYKNKICQLEINVIQIICMYTAHKKAHILVQFVDKKWTTEL